MKRYLSNFILFIILSLLPLAQAYADVSEEALIECEISALSWNETLRGLHIRQGDEMKQVIIPSGGLSLSLMYRGLPDFAFYRKGPNDEKGQPTWEPASVFVRLSAGRKYFMLLRNEASEDQPIKIITRPNELSAFSAGSYRFFNYTPNELACKLGDQEFVIAAGSDQVVSIEKPEEGYFVTFLANRVESQWQLLFKTKWAWSDNERNYVFVITDGLSEKAKLKIVSEKVNWR